MIRIHKPNSPDKLIAKGVEATEKICVRHEQGDRMFVFSDAIYADDSVKKALVDAQHGKCCYCEALVGGDGHVEHFRPVGACSQGEGRSITRPGYYWLAYQWTNLFLSCGTCNNIKRYFFPLKNESKRATSHVDSISEEEPLLIDPGHVNPEEHIEFHDHMPYPMNGSVCGKATITILRLDRSNLKTLRRERLEELRGLQLILNCAVELNGTEEGIKLLNLATLNLLRSTTDSAVFASMARCAAQRDFKEYRNDEAR